MLCLKNYDSLVIWLLQRQGRGSKEERASHFNCQFFIYIYIYICVSNLKPCKSDQGTHLQIHYYEHHLLNVMGEEKHITKISILHLLSTLLIRRKGGAAYTQLLVSSHVDHKWQ